MWQDSDYLEAYATEHTLRIQSLVIGEFNMNQYDNIEKIGNYRYRPNGTDGKFITVLSSYDPFDEGDFYTDAFLIQNMQIQKMLKETFLDLLNKDMTEKFTTLLQIVFCHFVPAQELISL